MRRGWIVPVVVILLLIGAIAVASSPLFRQGEEPASASGLEYALSYDRESGQFTFVVQNTSDQDINLEFATGEHYRIVVKQGGEPVFDSSEGMMFTQAVNYVDLKSGDELSFAAEWRPEMGGTYQVEAYFMAVSSDEPTKTLELNID